MFVDPPEMRPGGRSQAGHPAVCQDRFGAPRIGQARASFHETVINEPVDQPGHAALAEDHLVGQLPHPDPTFRSLGDGQERVVFADRQVVLGSQLLIEPTDDAGMRLEERAPRREPLVARLERSLHGRSDGHDDGATLDDG